jgi:hypothetical protein
MVVVSRLPETARAQDTERAANVLARTGEVSSRQLPGVGENPYELAPWGVTPIADPGDLYKLAAQNAVRCVRVSLSIRQPHSLHAKPVAEAARSIFSASVAPFALSSLLAEPARLNSLWSCQEAELKTRLRNHLHDEPAGAKCPQVAPLHPGVRLSLARIFTVATQHAPTKRVPSDRYSSV